MNNNQLTNLLPSERQYALSRGYFLRLGVVVLAMITILVCIAGLLLLPTYVFLTQSVAAKQAHLASVESILSSSNEIELSMHLTALSRDVTVLAALGDVPSASTILRSALAAPRPGITLSGFSYTPAHKSTPGTLEISGSAATRSALRTYQLALQNDPFAAAANLPVSAYAKDTDISFTVSVTLAP
ncbi:MAG: hypothetical protein AAB882_01010 [Patescibacteria group bacterium]